MRLGVREICNVVLRAKATQKLGSKTFYKDEPVLYFDTLKTSSLEGAATTVYAQGGRGNARLIAWDGERTLTFNMEDALISPEGFAILSGADLIAAKDTNSGKGMFVHTTSQIEVFTDKKIVIKGDYACWSGTATVATGATVDVDEYKNANADIFVMNMTEGEITGEPTIPAAVEYGVDEDGNKITTLTYCGASLPAGSIVFVDYYVKRTGANDMQIEITPDKFGGSYYLEADTLFRRESDGVDLAAEFIIPNCKIQSNFTFNMANSGDPSTFSFVLDAFPGYTKFNQTHKILAGIQVIDEENVTEAEKRECVNP